MNPVRRRLRCGLEQLEHRHMLAVTIMPIGDSLSTGLSPEDATRLGIPTRDSYRPELWDLMQAEFERPEEVEFVGTHTYNPTDLPPEGIRHSTYRGFWTLSFFPHPLENIGSDPDGEINSNQTDADGWGTINPDFALILLGTNDMLGNRRISRMETDLKRMVVELREDRPDVDILLGTLPPYDASRPQAELIPEANDVIRNLVNPDTDWAGSTEESPIHIVDHYNGVGDNPPFDLELHAVDGVHPNAAGDALLASNWWTVLEPLLEAPVPPPPPVIAMDTSSFDVDESVGSVEVVLSRTGDTDEALIVDYVTSGTATSGEDYDALSGQVVFEVGSSQATINVNVIDDGLDEPSETIVIQLQDGVDYDLASQDTATIVIPGIIPSVTIASSFTHVTESNLASAQFMVTRDGDVSDPLTVFFDLSGTARAGSDYLPVGNNVVIPAGQQSALIDIAIKDDWFDEPDETIVANLVDDSIYWVAVRSDMVTLVDNDDRETVKQDILANLGLGARTMPFRLS